MRISGRLGFVGRLVGPCLLLFGVTIDPAGAQTTPQHADAMLSTPAQVMASDHFMKFFASHGFSKSLYDLGVVWDVSRQAQCPHGQHQVKPLGVSEVLAPLSFPEGAKAPVGVFVFGFSMRRCDREITYKAIFAASQERPMQLQPWLPGDSSINFQLYRDAMPMLVALATGSAAPKDCKELIIQDTGKFEVVARNMPAMGGATGELRRERWWLRQCGMVSAVDFETYPNPNIPGLSFTLKPVKDAPQPPLR